MSNASYNTLRNAYKYFTAQHKSARIKLNSTYEAILDDFNEVAIRCFPALTTFQIATAINLYAQFGGKHLNEVLELMAENVKEQTEKAQLEIDIRITSVEYHPSYDNGTLRIKGYFQGRSIILLKDGQYHTYCGSIATDTQTVSFREFSWMFGDNFYSTLLAKCEKAIRQATQSVIADSNYTAEPHTGQLELFQTEDRQLALF